MVNLEQGTKLTKERNKSGSFDDKITKLQKQNASMITFKPVGIKNHWQNSLPWCVSKRLHRLNGATVPCPSWALALHSHREEVYRN